MILWTQRCAKVLCTEYGVVLRYLFVIGFWLFLLLFFVVVVGFWFLLVVFVVFFFFWFLLLFSFFSLSFSLSLALFFFPLKDIQTTIWEKVTI